MARTKGRIRALLAFGSVLGLGIVGTWAAFTDDAAFTTTISTGTVDITLNGDQGNPTAYTFTDLSKTTIKDGDDAYGALTVNNAGTLPFTYTVSNVDVSSSAAMAGAIDLDVKVVTGTCDATGMTSGTSIGSVTSFSTLTNMTARSLAVGTNEVLCFHWTFNASNNNALQGQTFTPVVTFTATQS